MFSVFSGFFLFGASGTGSTALELHGSIGARSLIGLSQRIGEDPGMENAIPLDSGDILAGSSGIGVDVGQWSISSNTSVVLDLRVEYLPFTVEIEGASYSIPYTLSNGTKFVSSGDSFFDLVRSNGVYSSQQNNGSIYLKRIDNEIYPPSFNYNTVITFQLESN